MKFFIRPAAPGFIVRDPVTREPLAAEGASKPRSRYWLRRVADGSCVEGAPAPAKRKSKPTDPTPVMES